jgi:hypothetical protein
MIIMILGGLVTSTLLILCLMPALYLAFGRVGRRPHEEKNAFASMAPGDGWSPLHAPLSLAAVPVPSSQSE